MRELLEDLERWSAAGEPVAIATVVSTWGSAPRRPGAKMAVSASGGLSGSVSGGCIEGAVAETAQSLLKDGKPRLLSFGVADETAWSVGLACGGHVDVFVAPLARPLFEAQRDALRAERPFACATVIRGAQPPVGSFVLLDSERHALGSLGATLDAVAREASASALQDGQCRTLEVGEAHLFVEPFLPPPKLVVVGAVHIAVTLVALARALGYQTIIVDPRSAFASPARFGHADRVLVEWPDEALPKLGLSPSTAIAVLSHDPKLDDPALIVALRSPAFYVGALGSAATQAKRRARLVGAGLGEHELSRLYGPIGLDLGGRTPEEIALAVMAQIVVARNGTRS